MTQEAIDISCVAETLALLRRRCPLVQNITNYVAMTVSANVLLAVGASPAMVHAVEEVEDFTAISAALAINIGTLSPTWVEAMRRAAKKAVSLGKPWVLDPVGCGATAYRTAVAATLTGLEPTIIRGNASEIMSLAGAAAPGGRGVDATTSSDAAVAAAVDLATQTGGVVVVTGVIDYATDGKRLIAVETGDAMMTLSTALGCALSATTAAFAAITTPLQAATAALAVYGAAGKVAASRVRGPGHLPAELCDVLHGLDSTLLARNAVITTRVL